MDVLYILNNKKKSNLFVHFVVLKKKIPTEIVEMLDKADRVNVDTDIPPRFDCEKYPGKMEPIY